MKHILIASVPCFLVFAVSVGAQAMEFEEEMIVCQTDEGLEFALNTHSIMAIDSSGAVHIVYFAPGPSSDPPSPEIRYQTIRENEISRVVRVDNAEIGGGKHPSLAIDNNDTVHVVWHDLRHSSPPGRWMDNLEIYYDKKSKGGSFLSNDIRITQTSADHTGDNGFLPKMEIGPKDRVNIVWYDFNANGNNADVYLRTSTQDGLFPQQKGIEEFRITSIAEGSVPGSPWTLDDAFSSVWTPSIAVFPDGDLYALWGFLAGFQGAFEIQGGIVSENRILEDVEIISPEGGTSTDPPRLTYDRSGNLGLAYMNRVDFQSRIQFQYRPYTSRWTEPIFIDSGETDATQPDVVFGTDNNAYVIYQEDIGGIYQIGLAVVSLLDNAILSRQVLSAPDVDARTPTLAVDSGTGRLHTAWVEKSFDDEWSIKYRRQQLTQVRNWGSY